MNVTMSVISTTLVVLFFIMKVIGAIDWPWIWIFAPYWIPLAIAAILFVIAVIISICIKNKQRSLQSPRFLLIINQEKSTLKNNKFKPSVRYINGVTIYFKTKTIVQVTGNGMSVDVVRWDKVGGGTYSKAWAPFCEKLRRNNTIVNIYQIMALAGRYSLTMVKTKHPEQPPDDIWVRPSKYIEQRRKNGRNIQSHKN